MKRTRGFSLVELLVVIAIIAILVAVLLPALSRAREASQRVACASNLHQWGHALTIYYNENRGYLPNSWGAWLSGLYAGNMSVASNMDVSLGGGARGVIALDMFAKILRGVDATNKRVYGVWRCPTASVMLAQSDAINAINWGTNANPGYINCDYQYFARSEKWLPPTYRADILPFPDDIVQNKLSANRLLMGDNCFRWGAPPSPVWWYNHGRRRGSSFFNGGEVGTPSFTGLNELYGDGHVVWKSVEQFDPAAMAAPVVTATSKCRFVKGAATDLQFY